MDQVIVSGLHTCKPQNAPTVGQIKCFLVTEETSPRTGNNWTKIKSAGPDKGGRYYRIESVNPTGRKDDHGNVSFNLDIEEAQPPVQPSIVPPPFTPITNAAIPQNQIGEAWPGAVQNARQNAPQTSANGPTNAQPTPRAIDTPRQHLMRSANLYNLCLGAAATVIRDEAQRKGFELTTEDVRQIATTLWIEAKGNGYIMHMSDKESKREPY